ncbi:hypothetical protein BOX15_Mlig023849g2 [Macrostomum lignano]|uniref:GPR180/TMEM145 transmembrane domain-containing protein n=1 Tax=Macrostomum lignano TaxID=282301 RepID=A0A267DH13_9PLAT|nr:hypothetical protein BOX15_Mlig023849g2 [Macrostomum lignano]
MVSSASWQQCQSLSKMSVRIVALSCIASLLLSVSPAVNALHIRGTWDSSRFYLFLAKFGVQKTVLESMAATRGYVYGNVTLAGQRQASSGRQRAPVTLVVVDSEYFQDLYTNSSRQPHNDESCRRMFNKIDRLAWHPQCRQQGKEDFLRSVPCPTGRLCPEEDEPSRVIPGWQLTYAIQDTKQPRYWYLSLVACSLNPDNCQWEATHTGSSSLTLAYDLWLVNGAPSQRHVNKLEHQFSFDEHDILEIYGVFLMLYAALAGAVHAKLLRRQEPFTWGVAAQCWLEVAGAFLCCVHLAKFAGDGVGASGLWAAGELLRRWADAVFILLLILAARLGLQGRPDPLGTGILLASFLTVSAGFYLWSLAEVSQVEDVGVFDTVPSCLLLALRFPLVCWFLAELPGRPGRDFGRIDVLQFAAGFLLWLVALPILVLVSETQVSALWRQKCVLSVSYGTNFVAASAFIYALFTSQQHDGAKYDYLMTAEESPEHRSRLRDGPAASGNGSAGIAAEEDKLN